MVRRAHPPNALSTNARSMVRRAHPTNALSLDAPALLAAALRCARRRVVVKRPRLAPALKGPQPDMRITAENTRFDVYLSA